MSLFHGRTYIWNTANNGPQRIGVCQVLGEQWAVCWVSNTGGRHRIKTARLPVVELPDYLQALFERWAGQRSLREFVP